MSHVFGFRVTKVISVIATVLLLRTYSVHCLRGKYGPSLAALSSVYRPNFAVTSNGEKQHSSKNAESLSSSNFYLGNEPGYSVLIPLATGKVTASDWEFYTERGTYQSGKFTVEAPTGYGVIAVIQALYLVDTEYKFRTAPDESLKGGQETFDLGKLPATSCTNYVKFGDQAGSETVPICGQIEPFSEHLQPEGLSGSRTFVSRSGQIDVSFGIGRRATGRFVPPFAVYQLAISFTAFTDCHSNEPEAVIPCLPSTRNNTGESCISVDLFCDNVINCGFESDFGHDEKTCHKSIHSDENSDEDKADLRNPEDSSKSKSLIYWTVRPSEDGEELPLQNDSADNPSLEEPYLNYTKYDPDRDRIFEYNLSPASTILLIVITVVCIMIMGLIIRFCSRKCVGTPLPVPVASNSDADSFAAAMALGSGATQMYVDIERSPYQCSRRNYEHDLPPSYDDLFPSEKGVDSVSFFDITAGFNQSGNPEPVKFSEN